MTFPDNKFFDASSFTRAYFEQHANAATTVDGALMQRAADILTDTHRAGATVYSCGNGGSAAIANHLVCDHCKGIQTDTDLVPRIVSLSATVEIITAISNDLSYDEVFLYQLRSLSRPGDALITVSSSGDSENVVRAAQWAKHNGVHVISMTGFSGGRMAKIADVNLHVDADNYGIIEDVHQGMMHVLAQYIRQAHMEEGTISKCRF